MEGLTWTTIEFNQCLHVSISIPTMFHVCLKLFSFLKITDSKGVASLQSYAVQTVPWQFHFYVYSANYPG